MKIDFNAWISPNISRRLGWVTINVSLPEVAQNSLKFRGPRATHQLEVVVI